MVLKIVLWRGKEFIFFFLCPFNSQFVTDPVVAGGCSVCLPITFLFF